MADFSFLSDTDDSAVEEILSEAMDHSVLKQVAALNCASFSDSVLPSNLESRFQRLKTFPSSASPHQIPLAQQALKPPVSDSPAKINPSRKPTHPESPPKQEAEFPPSISSNSSPEKENLPQSKARNDLDLKLRSGSFSPKSNSSPEKKSPPRKSGCLWCSPKKKTSRKKSKGIGIGDWGFDWGKDDVVFGSSLSSKEHKKILKEAMKEEEKISREAEKIVKWAKQASARMEISSIEDELNSDHDDDDCKHNFG